MDNKITKKRLFDFLSYEWIVMIIVVVLSILAWEFVYGIARVRLTPGQEFITYYDVGLNGAQGDRFDEVLLGRGTFSYDVLEVKNEGISSEFSVLSLRLSAYEGDVIYSSKITNEENPYARAKDIVDKYQMYDLEVLLAHAKRYLRTFLKDGVTEPDAELEYKNLSEQKIEKGFASRMKKDNRVRKDGEYNRYLKKEYQRIEKLCKDVADYEYFLTHAPSETFYRYTRYEQMVEKANDENANYSDYYKEQCAERLKEEQDAGRVNCIYGINMEALSGGQISTSQYVSLYNQATAKDIVLLVFDMEQHQPDHQYETVSFIVENVRMFSNILG